MVLISALFPGLIVMIKSCEAIIQLGRGRGSQSESLRCLPDTWGNTAATVVGSGGGKYPFCVTGIK